MGELCGAMIQERALQGLHNLINARRPQSSDLSSHDRFVADSSVKIALFSLGNLAVHSQCRNELTASTQTAKLCHVLMGLCQRDDMIYKYAERLLQKLAATS